MSKDEWDPYTESKNFHSDQHIFVFGSNETGRHGAGAALYAKRHFGAIPGQGYGLQGRSFGIPTKSSTLNTLPLQRIETYVRSFIQYAKSSPYLYFRLTPIGCGLAGYKPTDIAPMFKDAPSNVHKPRKFIEVLTRCELTYTPTKE